MRGPDLQVDVGAVLEDGPVRGVFLDPAPLAGAVPAAGSGFGVQGLSESPRAQTHADSPISGGAVPGPRRRGLTWRRRPGGRSPPHRTTSSWEHPCWIVPSGFQAVLGSKSPLSASGLVPPSWSVGGWVNPGEPDMKRCVAGGAGPEGLAAGAGPGGARAEEAARARGEGGGGPQAPRRRVHAGAGVAEARQGERAAAAEEEGGRGSAGAGEGRDGPA
mmetsp:Transcript_26552/g.85120  ORF Transcript_26552/g.85120 Transcript_26552/m.85120 type:complete len:218 (-) Transcript_26552:710-1363(-)